MIEKPGRIIAVLMVSTYMTSIGVSVFNVALPSVRHGLDASPTELQWVLAGYALIFGVVLVPAGRFGDVLGRRAVFLIGTLIFTLASAMAGLVSDATVLAVARVLQGFGAGISGPQGLGIVQQYFTNAQRARAMAWFGTTVGLAFVSGPLVGGTIVEVGGGWRWIFLVNIPFGVLTLVLGMLWIPRTAPTASGRGWADLDLAGAALLSVALFTLLLPFTMAPTSWVVWLLVPAGLLLGCGWVWWEVRQGRRGRSPMVDMSLFRVREFTHGVVVTSLYLLGTTNVWVLVALYMQDGLGYGAFESGLLALPSAVMTIGISRVVGRFLYPHGRAIATVGLVSLLIGLLASTLVVLLDVSEWWLLVTLAFVGIAQTSVILPTQTLALDMVPPESAGTFVGVMQTGQRVGAAVGITLITAVVFRTLEAADWTWAAVAGFTSIAMVILPTLWLALLAWRRDRSARGRARPRKVADNALT